MPRYLIARSFPESLEIPTNAEGDAVLSGVRRCNDDAGVHWLHSYVSDDRRTTFCLYDAPDPESLRTAAQAAGLPVDRIVRVDVLDPHAYRSPR